MRITSIFPQWQLMSNYSSTVVKAFDVAEVSESNFLLQENNDGDQVILTFEALDKAFEDKEELNDTEKRELDRMQKRDRDVRQHEQAHIAASGRISTSGAIYELEQGPDGKLYITEGKVNFSAPLARNAKEKLEIAQDLRRMALAPANPSAKDRSVAAKASYDINVARMELLKEEKVAAS